MRMLWFVLGGIARVLDSFVDGIVVFLRRTVFCDRALPYTPPEGNRVTNALGHFLERLRRMRCATAGKEYEPGDYVHRLSLKRMEFSGNVRLIGQSASFGMVLFCVAIGLALVYLLAAN